MFTVHSSNGAHANSNLTHFGPNIPDTRAQIKEYLSDLKAGKIYRKKGKLLYIWWVGINPIDAIWNNACDQGARHATDALFRVAMDRVNLQVKEVWTQVKTLMANPDANTSVYWFENV